uniref:Ycf36 n=1 Tax=Cyanidium sp. THAL103 TaxID=3027999 RepID=A0A9Y1I433_9RHOD|nr:hypothetical protein CspTHAL103_017 [Cyanidium sp. THAL103]
MPVKYLKCPIPQNQIPYYQYKNFKQSLILGYRLINFKNYQLRLFLVWILIYISLSELFTNLSKENCSNILLCIRAVFMTNIIISMIMLYWHENWKYLSYRCLSAFIAYEENNWYDGSIWFKSRNMLYKDKSLNKYNIFPTLIKIRKSLFLLTTLSLGLLLIN